MVFEISRQDDIILPLVEGIREVGQWERFLAALMARTQARRAVMLISLASAPAGGKPLFLQQAAPRAVQDPAIDMEWLHSLQLQPFRALRPGRVYAIDELLDHDNRPVLDRQQTTLAVHGVRFGRWMRVAVDRMADAWILLTREREDFSAGAVTALSSVAPYLRAALRTFVSISEDRLARNMAQATLARLGIGQFALDETARVIVTDAMAEQCLTFVETPDGRPGRKLLLPAPAADRLERSCAAFASGRDMPPQVLVEVDETLTLMLQPATPPVLGTMMSEPVAIATLRMPVREDERRGASVLREHFRLSPREAALAERISRGETITEAGRQLRLTEETARNYSKRIYARTGSRGQADLVRKILCGLTPLA